MAEVQQWPAFNCASANLFLTKKQRKELAKERHKGKAVRGTCGTRREEATKMTVVSNCAEDSAASFDIGRVSHPDTIRAQPMRVAKLHRRIVVDASNLSDADAAAPIVLVLPPLLPLSQACVPTAMLVQVQPPPPGAATTEVVNPPFPSNRL